MLDIGLSLTPTAQADRPQNSLHKVMIDIKLMDKPANASMEHLIIHSGALEMGLTSMQNLDISILSKSEYTLNVLCLSID